MVPIDYAKPGKGDLVFFERKHRECDPTAWPITWLICGLDWNHPGMKVSHVGIVDDSPLPEVVENTLHARGVSSESLHTACHPEPGCDRRLLVVRNPFGAKADAVLHHAKAMSSRSEYSVHQLLLSGLAAVLRRMPCTDRRNRLWEQVHQFSRHLVEQTERDHDAKFFSGTCAGMVAEAADRAKFDSPITEPECQDPSTAAAHGLSVLSTVLDLAAVAWDVADDAGEDCVAAVYAALESLPSLDEWNDELERRDDEPDEPDENVPVADPATVEVRFGPHAARHVVKELHHFGMVLDGVGHLMLKDLHVTFAVLDHLVHPRDDAEHAPGHGDAVYPALMSLGLMLDHLRSDYKTYTYS